MDELKSQLGLSQDKLHKQAQDATRRDEQLVVLKVELATLQEKHRLIQEEVFVKCLICLFFPVASLIFINTVHSLGIGSVSDYWQLPTYPSPKLKSTAITS